MGDGGVACMPSQLAVERYSASEKLCGGEFVLLPEKKMRELEGSRGSSSLEKGSRKVEERTRVVELEKGEFVPPTDRKRRGESDKVSESVENGELENGEFVPDEWRKVELEKGEIVPDRWRRGESERSDIAYARGHKVELEKGEFVPDSKWRTWDRERSLEGHYNRKELDRRSRSSTKLDGCSHERREDTGASSKYDNGNEKGHGKENGTKESCPRSWLKRHSLESKSSGSKRYNEVTERSSSKNRRISKESNNSRSEHLDKSNKSTVVSSKNSSNTRYSSSRHNEPTLPHRGGFDKHVRSPDSNRTWNHELRTRSPLHLERSPNANRSPQRTPGHLEKSPHGRSRRQDYRDRPPGFSGWSAHEKSRNREHKSKIPFRLEHPNCRGSSPDHRETGQGNLERKNRRSADKTARKDSNGRNTSSNDLGRQPSNSTIDYPDKSGEDRSSIEKESRNHLDDSAELPHPPSPILPPPPPPLMANTVQEELPSMEEDMDICDTPPHAGTTDTDVGKWYYLDHFGIEQGPSRLMDLKQLVEEGFLLSDHLIKHSDSDRWVTVENAASPLLYSDLSSIASDAVTMMASPPQAPGNVISDFEDICNEKSISLLQLERDSVVLLDLKIDERIGALLDGYSITPGKELEAIGEALATSFVHVELDNWDHSEGFTRFQVRSSELPRHQRDDEAGQPIDYASKEAYDFRITAPSEKEYILPCDSSEWFAGRWSCKGGDWKRNDDAVQDRSQKRKLVLNDGYPLCQMPKCGFEDPRWKLRDDLYHASCSKRLDLPSWAFSWVEEKSDGSTDSNKTMLTGRSCQARPLTTRGTKGTVLPVIRINACVVKDHGSSTLEPRSRGKSKDRHSSKTVWSQSGGSERMLVTEATQSKRGHENYLHSDNKSGYSISIPSDHVCTKDELALNMGDWYYLDGAGREQGPYIFSELSDLVAKNTIMEHSSVFRKADNIWVPISTRPVASGSISNQEQKSHTISSYSSLAPPQHDVDNAKDVNAFSSFHSSYPQFIGFMCGKLHELVMKSYKSREFAAAINGVLDPWINANQPKEIDMHFSYNSSISKSSSVLTHEISGNRFWRPEEDFSGLHGLPGKRARLTFGGSGEDHEIEEDLLPFQKNKYSFEDLCTEASFAKWINASFHAPSESWGLLNCHILARIFHFLRSDMKSLFFSSVTCKHWKMAVSFYKGISKYVDFSPAGPSCTDTLFQSVMSGYNKNMITTIILARCTNVSCSALEEVMKSFPGISDVDIRGCNQFRELVPSFQNVQWLQSQNSYSGRNLGDPYSKARSLKQITEKSYTMSKSLKGSSSYLDSFDDTARFGSNGIHMDRKGFKNEMFKQGYYRKTKLLDARKSSGALSRDAQLKQLIRKKSENAYKKMEPLISDSLKNIMKENTFDFLIPKVVEIQDRMISGYYLRHGLNSVKDDIRLMCRNMMKYKKQFNTGDLKQLISSFIQLVERLEKPKKSYEKDGEAKPHIDGSEMGFYSADAKSRKKQGKTLSDRRSSSRNANTSYGNGGAEYGGSALDRGIKRSLSKLRKKYKDSESETSDDGDLFEEDAATEGESTGSETESDLEFRTEAGMGNQDGYFILDDTTDTVEEREWGARMTKASLVPPVTRKYEVIDQYLIVADESEVERKMRVTLPEDYDEKLREQSNGIEEMEIPEVKEYKPRKMVGEDVLEQEVYGIDPYTHNLLLDSMSKEMECSLTDMHHFIEEILLRTLNKQVRHFTGSGNAPMVYQLQPVIEEIKRTAEEDGDMCITKMCLALSKTMRSRSIENYVAYRKGLGVVCNKKDGFGVDDFVVEFLGEVYPAWKWYEKQDGIRSLQKDSKEPLPEFYNIYLERPKGDGEGYDLVVVDAMHKANYASRICHSCKPNCEAKVTAVEGHYQIGIYTREPIAYGEEITFDYNSVTESKDEYEASVCLCGSQVCRGSFLNLTGEDAFQNVLKECHGILDRHKLMLEACEANSVSEEDYLVLGRAGLGTCLLSGLPNWLIAYSAHLVRFINFERKKLPGEIVKLNVEEKMKYIPNYNPEDDKIDAEVQAEGVYNQRLQNMAITIDKVKYVMRSVFGDPKKAPPPLERLGPDAVVSALWKGEGSLVNELLKSLGFYMEADALNSLKSKIRLHDPSGSDDIMTKLRKSLLWLRDQIRDLPCSQRCRNDAAADLIHMYAYTKYFFRVREYESFTSPPVYISPLDMGPKYMEMLGSGFQEYCKTYGKNYCLGQLIYWHNQTNPDPDSSLSKSRRGCLALPDISSFYANNQKPLRRHIYGSKTLGLMLRRMEKQPQKPWPRDEIWEFKSSPKSFGSPMMDAVLTNRPLDNDMVHWLKNRPAMFQGAKDG